MSTRELDDTELEPGEAERAAGMLALGWILADILAHPEGARAVMRAIAAGESG